MCQYQYHYYGHCQHQEFILVKFCERAAPLAQPEEQQEDIKTEAATVQAPPADETSTSSSAANSQTHSPTDNLGVSFNNHHPLSNILKIVDSMAHPSEAPSQFSQELDDEVDSVYNEFITGGKPTEYYTSIGAQLQAVLDAVRRLEQQSIPASDFDSGRSSAATKLQQIHERIDRTTSQSSLVSASSSHLVPLDGFPALSIAVNTRSSEVPSQSYAKVVRDSLPAQPQLQPVQAPVVQETVSQASSSELVTVSRPPSDPEDEWCVVDRSGRGTRPSKSPKHATVDKRSTDRHARKSLPQAWMMNDDVQPVQPLSEEAPKTAHVASHKPLQRTARVKGPHTQLASHQANSLKSKPSKPTLSKATATKTPSYASPTKASKHRTTGLRDSVRSPSPCKSRSIRVDASVGTAISSSEQQPPSRLGAASALDNHRKVLATHGKRPVTPASVTPAPFFGLDGTFEFDQSHVLQAFSGNSGKSTRRPSKKAKLDLKITIPDPSKSLSRPLSPSRIPVAVPSSIQSMDTDPNPFDPKLAQAVGPGEIDQTASKPIDRASTLDPLRRRLSGASSKSQSQSSGSDTELQRRDSAVKRLMEAATMEESEVSVGSDTTVEITTQSKTQQPRSTAVPAPVVPLNPASTMLFDTIKQTAEAHAARQGLGEVKAAKTAASSSEAQQAKKLHEFQAACHSRQISCSSSPDRDPAVLKCGPVKCQAPKKAEKQPKPVPIVTSLRATAAHFVPTPVSDTFALPKEPERQPSFAYPLPLGPPALLPSGLGFAPTMSLPTCPQPVFPLTMTEKPMQQSLPQLRGPFDGRPDWIPQDEWLSYPYETQTAIIRERKERGSSSSSSAGLSSAIFSNMATGSSFSSPALLADPMDLNRSYYDWVNRFGRASLQAVPRPEDEERRGKGWDVKSAAPGWRYGWRGGDGREISFQGDGPVAERNPNAPVNFNEHEGGRHGKDAARSAKKGQQRGGYSSSKRTRGSPNSRVKQWARNANYPSVPCGSFDVTQAIEHLPYSANYPDAWCHDCFPAHI
ncbi:hypothetical protein D6D26_04184 [Aureobasidium pullulans]|nr:hypothetical protein D6D26_04184 [Aureobasidium pullulans]